MTAPRQVVTSQLNADVGADSVLLNVSNLTVDFPSSSGDVTPVSDVSLRVHRGRSLGLVGESGSGKSVTLRAIMGLVARPGRIRSGRVEFLGQDLVGSSPRSLRALRGGRISMIFQDPAASLNPVLSVGDQLVEVLRFKAGLSRGDARVRAAELFEMVGIIAPRQRLKSYAHELSGGMAQRVMIAMAIAGNPDLILADEPTTALDVSVQDQVLRLLSDLRSHSAMGMIIVSHDMGVIARTCDDVAVMYGGRILELGPVRAVLDNPRHPYTRLLLDAMPSLNANVERRPLKTIGGQLPDLRTIAVGCPFVTRCPHAEPGCTSLPMTLGKAEHVSACPVVSGEER